MRLALLFSVVAGCTSASEPTVIGSSRTDTGVAADTSKPDTAVAEDVAVADTALPPIDTATHGDDVANPEDSAADAPLDAPKPAPVDCFTGAFGPSSTTLVDFFYELQVDSCTSSMCSDFIKFDPSCVMTLQVKDVETKATLDSSDCTILKKWLTSDLLVTHMRDTVTCYYGKDGPTTAVPFESNMLTLGDGPANKKTWSCLDEPFASHRKCLNAFRTKYFPGK
jgi:hypothetical protein